MKTETLAFTPTQVRQEDDQQLLAKLKTTTPSTYLMEVEKFFLDNGATEKLLVLDLFAMPDAELWTKLIDFLAKDGRAMFPGEEEVRKTVVVADIHKRFAGGWWTLKWCDRFLGWWTLKWCGRILGDGSQISTYKFQHIWSF